MNVVLFGFMATGKTSVGRLLADRLGWAFLDTDAMIEKEVGASVKDIFATGGEAAFRQVESRTVGLVSLLDKTVISTGGGVPLDEKNVRDLSRNGLTVCLTAKPETILERLKDEADVRPLLQGGDPYLKVHRLLSDRREAYARAKHQVATDGLTPAQVADRVMALLPSSPA
jgi:shikimate kinase